MTIGEYLKSQLEETFLGKQIKNWNGEFTFTVAHITVENGGVDPQWEISLNSDLYKQMMDESREWQKANNPLGGNLAPKELQERWNKGFVETFTMCFCDDAMPVIVERECEEEPDIDLPRCAECGEHAWDGYICHACGSKNI